MIPIIKLLFGLGIIGSGGILLWYGGFLAKEGWDERREQVAITKVKNIPDERNVFSDLIKLIERNLAPEGARINHAAVIKDTETGEYRKVPLLIEKKIGAHNIKIAVEYIDSQQPAAVEWIDSIIGKYRALSIPNVCLVSRSGFTPAAHKKAKAANIQLLYFKEALDVDWSKIINKLNKIVISSLMMPYLADGNIIMPSEVIPKYEIDFNSCNLISPDGNVISTLAKWADNLLHDKEVLEELSKKIEETKSSSFGVKITEPLKGFSIQTPNNEKFPVHAIELTVKFYKELKVIDLDKASYGDAQVAFGSAETMGYKIIFMASEMKSGPAKVGISIRKIEDKKE